jgi:hypothetical protein
MSSRISSLFIGKFRLILKTFDIPGLSLEGFPLPEPNSCPIRSCYLLTIPSPEASAALNLISTQA